MVSRETYEDSLTRYAHLIYEANKDTNLVSRRLSEADIRDLAAAHAELLQRCRHPGSADRGGLDGKRLLDIGSGAGLPGIPLKLRHAELVVVLSESRKLRVLCLERFVRELHLHNVSVVSGNVRQSVPETQSDPAFDIVTAFGVGKAADVIGLVSPFLSSGGYAYVSIPAIPEATDIAQWHLQSAFEGLSAEPMLGVLADGRSVLRLHDRSA